MISAALFIYIGVQIGAPWWYYTLIGVVFFTKMLSAGIKLGKKVGEQAND